MLPFRLTSNDVVGCMRPKARYSLMAFAYSLFSSGFCAKRRSNAKKFLTAMSRERSSGGVVASKSDLNGKRTVNRPVSSRRCVLTKNCSLHCSSADMGLASSIDSADKSFAISSSMFEVACNAVTVTFRDVSFATFPDKIQPKRVCWPMGVPAGPMRTPSVMIWASTSTPRTKSMRPGRWYDGSARGRSIRCSQRCGHVPLDGSKLVIRPMTRASTSMLNV